MKYSQIFQLREVLLKDKRQFTPKDYSKEIMYKSLKENILERIKRVEELEAQKSKWFFDIDKHLKRLKDKMDIDFKAMLETQDKPPAGQGQAGSSQGRAPIGTGGTGDGAPKP